MDFWINGIRWQLIIVPANSPYLMKSDGAYTIGVTDGNLHVVFISEGLSGEFLRRVITHEITHTIMFSYNIYMDIYCEEIMCNVVELHLKEILCTSKHLYKTLGGET